MISDHMNRMRIGFPFSVSSAQKVPTPLWKLPLTGGSSGGNGVVLSIHQIDHCLDLASNDRGAAAAISTARNLEHVVVDISVATHQWLPEQCPFEFDPLVTIGEAFLQLSTINSPMPD